MLGITVLEKQTLGIKILQKWSQQLILTEYLFQIYKLKNHFPARCIGYHDIKSKQLIFCLRINKIGYTGQSVAHLVGR